MSWRISQQQMLVMAGFIPANHVVQRATLPDVVARDKPEHDAENVEYKLRRHTTYEKNLFKCAALPQ